MKASTSLSGPCRSASKGREVPSSEAEEDHVPIAEKTLGLLVAQVGHRMVRLVEKALGDGGLTIEQWRVLGLLADGAGHPMSEIAQHAMVPPPTLTKIVDRLVDVALVYRRPDEADRRRVLAFLSDHGRVTYATLAPQVEQAELELVGELSSADYAQLQHLLMRIAG
jgi:MarR family transcriptional regulator, organic hydroperoxide resistance regulator